MKKALTKTQFLKRAKKACEKVEAEISANAKRSSISGGLSMEGYAGGYLNALYDVMGLLEHGNPNDTRNYWSEQ